MKLAIQLRGQLAAAAAAASLEREFAEGVSAAEVVGALAAEFGGEFAAVALDGAGAVRRTLLVAADGAQVADPEQALAGGVRELTLLPPIAGG